MKKAASTNRFVPPNISKSPSKRTIYINQEFNKKEVSTPFHSPYKDGRRNPNYSNPSFISSNLFYPKDYTETTSPNLNVTSNLVPNRNDIKKEELFRKRMNTQYAIESKKKEEYPRRQFPQKDVSRYRVLRANEPQSLLRNDYENLQGYRQEIQQKKERIKEISRKRYQQPVEPVYLQKAKVPGRTLMTFSPHKAPDYQHKAMVYELDHLKKQLRGISDEQQYRCNLDQLVIRNQQLILDEDQQIRKQKQLLGNILRQQIKTNREIKDKRWKY